MNTEFHLQYENELPIVGEIARTTANSARPYPSRYRDSEFIVIREFSFLDNVSRLLTAIQKRSSFRTTYNII